ncbi:PKD domain-containing protein [bacterium]|nr:PKD domain-containing protein [bacterium]
MAQDGNTLTQPAFPPAADDLREASLIQSRKLLGREVWSSSDDSIVIGDQLLLDSGTALSAFAVYRFSGIADADELQFLLVTFAGDAPDSYFLGLADFASGRWSWSEHGTALGSANPEMLDIPAAGDFISTNGHVYAACVLPAGQQATLSILSLDVDFNELAPVASFMASPEHGNAALEVELDAATSSDRNGGGIQLYAWDFDNDGSFDETTLTPVVTHVYTDPGEYFPRLRVTDADDGLSDEASQRVVVHGWITSWGTSATESMADVLYSDGRIYLLGSTDDESGRSDALLVCLDQSGAPLWQRMIGDASDEFGVALAAAEGGVLVLCSTRGYGSLTIHPLLCRLDRNGTLLWSSSWNADGNSVPATLSRDIQGSCYVSCITNSFNAGVDSDVLLLKFGLDGAMIWQRLISGNLHHWEPKASQLLDDLFLAGSAIAPGSADAYVYRVAADGTLLDAALLDIGTSGYPKAIAADFSGRLYLTGYWETSPLRPFIARLDNQLDADLYSEFEYDDNRGSVDTLLLEQSIFGVSSVYASIHNSTGSTLVRFSGGLVRDWSRSFDGLSGALIIRATAPGTDGSTLLAGIGTDALVLSHPEILTNPGSAGLSSHANAATIAGISGVIGNPVPTVSPVQGVLQDGGGSTDLLIMSYDLNDL